MFVQAKQAPVDAQSSVCLVQELTNLYLAWIIHDQRGSGARPHWVLLFRE